MNKAISITLNGAIFQIEENAYEKLDDYLKTIKRNLGKNPDAEEIIADIESNISEKFAEKINAQQALISLAIVDEIINVMGDPEIFINPENEETEEKDEPNEENHRNEVKKLYRHPDDVIIAGVCSGIAAYFGIDPVIVRVMFVLSIFLGGLGIVTYLLLWLIVPVARTNAQKIEMTGEPVTLAAIEQTVKKNFNKLENEQNQEKIKSVFRKIIEIPFIVLRAIGKGFGKIFGFLIPIIAVSLGLCFFIVGIVGIAAIVFGLVAVLFQFADPQILSNLPLNEIINENQFRLGAIIFGLAIIIPFIFFLQTGVSLIKRKNTFTLLGFGLMISLFIAGIIGSAFIEINYLARLEEYMKVQDNQRKILELSDFQKITVKDNLEVIIKEGDKYFVEAIGYGPELEKISASQNEGSLNLEKTEEKLSFCLFCTSWRRSQIIITMPDLQNYQGEDFSQASISGFNKNLQEIIVNDAASVQINGNYPTLNLEINDAGQMELSGSIKQLNAQLADAAKLDGVNCQINSTEIKLSDASGAELNVEQEIIANLTDVAVLRYYGQAQVTEKFIGPVANIIHLEKQPVNIYDEEIEVNFELE